MIVINNALFIMKRFTILTFKSFTIMNRFIMNRLLNKKIYREGQLPSIYIDINKLIGHFCSSLNIQEDILYTI